MKRPFKPRILFPLVAVLSTVNPSWAQVRPPAGASQPLAELLIAVETLRIRVENIQILSRYCKAPNQPDKSGPEIDINLESLLLKRYLRDFFRVEQSFINAGNSVLGGSYRASFPVIDGIDANDQNDSARYWAAAKQKLTTVQNLLAERKRRLDAAPEQDCAPQQARKPAPQDPVQPPDPLAGLKRPFPRPINIPQAPNYFCTDLERRQWYLNNFASEYEKAGENAADASAYRAEVSRRGAEHANKGGEATQQKRLDGEERWADENSAQQQRMVRLTDSIRLMVLNTQLIDCSLLHERFVIDPAAIGAEIERVENEIKTIDSNIKQTESDILQTEQRMTLIDGMFSDTQGNIISQEMEDLAEEEKFLRDYRNKRIQNRDELKREKTALQGEIERSKQLIDDIQKADAGTAGTPRPSAEPEQRVEEKSPSLFESLIPALIPSIGIGGRRDGDLDRRERR
jgi:hypothetical protein